MLFTTPPGAIVGGVSVSASALFQTTAGQLTIVLSNTMANITSDSAAVSGLEFDFDPAVTGTTTLASDTGTTISVSNHVGTPDSTVIDAGWAFGTFNSEDILCIICQATLMPPYHTAPPSHLILGPGPYTNANSSIDNHSPFMNQSVTFTITNPNITANTQIADVLIRFSTTFADSEEINGLSTTPEPGTFGLAVIPALLLLVAAKKSARKKQLALV